MENETEKKIDGAGKKRAATDTTEKKEGKPKKKRITLEEQIAKANEKMTKEKRKLNALVNRQKEIGRKERTRRLIANGALVEKYLGCQEMSPADFEMFLARVVSLDNVKEIIASKNMPE